MHEETFGPVLPVVAFDTLEEALKMANDSDYGLTSSVYTQDLNVAMKAIKGLKFGETYINRENFEAMQGFHAGWRKSGIGGADGKHGLNEYLQTQVVYLQSYQSPPCEGVHIFRKGGYVGAIMVIYRETTCAQNIRGCKSASTGWFFC